MLGSFKSPCRDIQRVVTSTSNAKTAREGAVSNRELEYSYDTLTRTSFLDHVICAVQGHVGLERSLKHEMN